MNIEHGYEAIRLITEQPENKFDMSAYFCLINSPATACDIASAVADWGAHPCNTVCCLAGLIQMHHAERERDRETSAHNFARRWMGINGSEANWLFLPTEYGENSWPIAKDTVIERIEWLIAYEEAHIEELARNLEEKP